LISCPCKPKPPLIIDEQASEPRLKNEYLLLGKRELVAIDDVLDDSKLNNLRLLMTFIKWKDQLFEKFHVHHPVRLRQCLVDDCAENLVEVVLDVDGL